MNVIIHVAANQYYKDLVQINGTEDPLRKTLLIIDEAHKLYGGTDLSEMERPNMKQLKGAIMNSYIKSGKDSVRLLLMTASPITQNPMELIQLINLCKLPQDQLPETFDEFSRQYLDEDGIFTEQGEKKFEDENAGIVSYLNREFDARQFAQPEVSIEATIMATDKEIEATNMEYYEEEYKKLPIFKRTQKYYLDLVE